LLEEHLSQTLSVYRNLVISRCIVLLSTSLSGYALLNASRTAENDFDEKEYLTLNTRSGHERTTFAAAQLFRNWHKQRPSNKNDLESSNKVEVVTCFWLNLCTYAWMLLACVFNGTLCIWISHVTFLSQMIHEYVLKLSPNEWRVCLVKFVLRQKWWVKRRPVVFIYPVSSRRQVSLSEGGPYQ
jgi:hypothetical protein